MPSRTVSVGSAVGLHARPAAVVAAAAQRVAGAVRIGRPGEQPVDARSALLLMTLGVGCGDTVVVTGDDQAAVDAITALLERDLDGYAPDEPGSGRPAAVPEG